ncbi:MAG: ATP-dependent DNA helicase UvrD2 [Acidimicrobiales bacterium]|nr:ATP-dependent DNA helicase UvrD2 [Acidimicrobiales bacterium]
MSTPEDLDEPGFFEFASRDQDPRFDRLDRAQQRAVDSVDAPLRILAGPGSGKTRVLTNRIARRVADGTADARRVLALTFTRRAANQLRSRLNRIGIRDLGAVGTFHAVALAQIRQYRSDNGKRAPVVLPGRRPLLNELVEDLPGLHLNLAAAEIDWACSQALTPDEYRNGPGGRRVGHGQAARIAELHQSYIGYKRRRGLLDFDDILVECAELLANDHAFRDAQHWVFRHLFVDEYQDLNQTQFNLLQAWVGDRTDLCVVGDPDQAIYGWNGADAGYLLNFCTDFPSAGTEVLTTNHRSQPHIIRAADAVLGRTSPESLLEVADEHFPTTSSFSDEWEEAVGISRYLRDERLPETRWSRHAVLARTNDQLRLIARALSEFQIPHRLRGQGGLLKLPEVRDVIDQLCSAGNDLATLAADLFEEFDHGPQSRIAELAVQYANEHAHVDGSGFRDWLRTLRPGDLDGGHDGVDLVTFHAAKGLEWPSVVIAGVENGLIPIQSDDPEERRLFYVAVSRAQQRLHLTWAQARNNGQRIESREPSPWLQLIDTADRRPSRPSAEQTAGHLAATRKVLGTNHDEAAIREQRLRDWVADTARARRIEPAALLPDHLVAGVAAASPTTLAELEAVTGFGNSRLALIGPEILKVIAEF